MKESNWSYLAGLIDGEGYIGITKGCRYYTDKENNTTKYPAYSINITISNNSLDLMKYLVEHFGGKYYTHTRSNPNANIGFMWQPKGIKNKEKLLLAVLPHLVIKTRQAQLILDFIRLNGENNPEKREEFHRKSLILNRRGLSPTTNTLDGDNIINRWVSYPEHLTIDLPKIESELHGDVQSAPVVIQGVKNPLDGLFL